MQDLKKLSHLIQLADDDSAVVRDTLMKELASWGPSLERDLSRLVPMPTEAELRAVRALLFENRRRSLKNRWPGWFELPGDNERLEAALTLLSEYQGGGERLEGLLDSLISEYCSVHPQPDVRTLANFLFKAKKLRGASADYYNPDNSNIVHVIESKQGLPISLACVYILTGHRLGLPVDGCNLPGHFMARVHIDRETFLVDCFDGGRFLESSSFTAGVDAASADIIRHVVHGPTPAHVIIGRVLANLMNAFRESKREDDHQIMSDLLEALQKRFGGQEEV